MNFIVERGELNTPLYTEKQKDYIISQYVNNKDVSLLSLSKQFNVSPPTLKKLMIKEGVALKTLRDYRMIYSINEHFFDEIDTEEKAYWLGFLYADGVVNEDENRVRLNLSKVDKNHLVKFKRALSSTHPIKETSKTTSEKTYEGVYVSFRSSHMVKALVEKGCFQRKTEELLFPTSDVLPDSLVHHFIRGYFDGDGSISYTTPKRKHSNRRAYKIGITGTENMVDNIKQILGLTVKTQKYNNMRVIQPGGNRQCERIFQYLYKDATVFLDRKYKTFIEMVSYIEENPYIPWNKKNKQ